MANFERQHEGAFALFLQLALELAISIHCVVTLELQACYVRLEFLLLALQGTDTLLELAVMLQQEEQEHPSE